MPNLRSMRGATILVVDDDEDIRSSLSDLLEMAGYRVVTACNGHAALARVQDGHPDLILLDLMMPGMDGAEFMDQIASDPRTASIPIVVATASSSMFRPLRTVAAIMHKPFGAETLREVVAQALARPTV